MFEKLNRALVLLRRRPRTERAQVAPLARLRVFLARVQPVAACLEFANHAISYAEARVKKTAIAAYSPRPSKSRRSCGRPLARFALTSHSREMQVAIYSPKGNGTRSL